MSIAMKYLEDDPLEHWHLFPGMGTEDLECAEWAVLEALQYRLR
jgi:hypothetical protein